jgi:hypothetical protein
MEPAALLMAALLSAISQSYLGEKREMKRRSTESSGRNQRE